jgi:glycosyltransferase involved in cell wall biosynthesis
MNSSEGPALRFGLESELPAQVAVGRGNMLMLHGWCAHAQRPIRRLEVVVDGECQPLLVQGTPRPDLAQGLSPAVSRDSGYRSGFLGLVALGEIAEPRRIEIGLAARLAGGSAASRRVAEISLLPDGHKKWAAPAGDDPAVAICMPTFNPPPELFRRQIDSIRAQRYENWTCLISDDDSDSEAFAMIEEVVGDDPRFQLEKNPRRLGVYRNFERLLGSVPVEVPLVALADQDDRWQADKLAVLAERVAAGAALAYSDARIVTADGVEVSPTFWTERANNPDDLGALLMVNAITGGASLFRAELLDYALPFPATQGTVHDHWIAMVAMSLGEVAYVDRPLYDYVQHPGAALGHESLRRPDRARRPGLRALRSRAALRDSLADRFAQMQTCFYIVVSVRASAELLLRRGGEAVSRRKRRTLRRCAGLQGSPAGWAWLLWRMVRARRPRSKTMGVERLMLAGLLWRPALRAARLLRLPAPRRHPRTMAAMLKLPRPPEPSEAERPQALLDEGQT